MHMEKIRFKFFILISITIKYFIKILEFEHTHDSYNFFKESGGINSFIYITTTILNTFLFAI